MKVKYNLGFENLKLGRGWNKGKHLSEEHRKRISESNKGNPALNTPERNAKISKAHKGMKKPWVKVGFDINSPRWKGNEVGYSGLHKWVKRNNGSASLCVKDVTHEGPYCWANITGEYRRDLSDWHELCYSCNKLDGIKKAKRFKYA